jgi:hypothetical protein
MCNDCRDAARQHENTKVYDTATHAVNKHSESYMLQELKHKRDKVLDQLTELQNAIYAVSRVDHL